MNRQKKRTYIEKIYGWLLNQNNSTEIGFYAKAVGGRFSDRVEKITNLRLIKAGLDNIFGVVEEKLTEFVEYGHIKFTGDDARKLIKGIASILLGML